ncbi:MAG: hypothetical protein U0232_30500 [Thermomicrobiales bacterium]
MPTVTLNGYTPFIQKITLIRLLKATLGIGLKQAKDEVERLLSGDTLRIILGSSEEAKAFLQAVTAIGVSGAILDDTGSPLAGETGEQAAPIPVIASCEPVIVGPTWVIWGEPASESRAAPEDQAKARQVLQSCQRVVDDESTPTAAISANDSDDPPELARFTDWLRFLADSEIVAALTIDRTDTVTTPVLTAFGMYLALSRQGRVFAAIRYL